MSVISRFHNWSFWSRPTMLWLAHAAPVTYILAAFTGPNLRHIPSPWLAFTTWVIMTVLIMVSVLAEYAHEVQMCTRCANNTPLNRTRAARLVRATLWLHHRHTVAVAVLLAMVVGTALGSMPDALTTPAEIVAWLCFAALAHSMLVHRAHRPWCPYCNGGWHEDPGAPTEPVLDPTPPGKNTPVS